MERENQWVFVRGGGDIATGTIHKLYQSGYPVLILEIENPSAIRRQVAFSEAVYDGECEIEGLTCVRVQNFEEAKKRVREGKIPLLVDENCDILREIKPWALVDAILAKRNLGTSKKMAKKTVGLGPGFVAGEDVDIVIETMRGHNLGRIIRSGAAAKNTGVPGMIAGFGKERVLHAEHAGKLYGKAKIGDIVEKNQVIAVIRDGEQEFEVKASLSGLLRGLIRDGYFVTEGFKIADIDPRKSEYENCFTISDKARCIAGSVLEALLYLECLEKKWNEKDEDMDKG